MEVSIVELSKQLEVSPDTIERWIRQGKLPVSRKGSRYRFKPNELKRWATANNIRLRLETGSRPEKQPRTEATLAAAVQHGGVYFDIQGEDVVSVLGNVVDTIAQIPTDKRSELLDQLIERETALSTGIGNGVAVPHPRQQQAYLKDPMVFVCYLATPVNYKALDDKEVSVLFLILCPELKMHLQVLSAISLCLKDPAFIRFLNTQPGLDDLIEQINVIHSPQS